MKLIRKALLWIYVTAVYTVIIKNTEKFQVPAKVIEYKQPHFEFREDFNKV